MSDIIKSEPNEGKDSGTYVGDLDSGTTPHSGKLAPEAGGEVPVVDHAAPLSEAILTPPEHPGTLLESETRGKKRWLKPVGATIAGMALALGAYAAGDSSDDGEPSEISTPTTDLLVPSTTEQEPTTTSEDSGETLNDQRPVLMTATTYNGLTSQLKHNLLCMFNSSYQNIQEKCLAYIVGDEPGNLTSLMQQRLANVNDHRISNPDYKVEIDFSDPTPGSTQDNLQISGNTAVLVTRLTDDVSSEVKRYSFRRVPVSIQEVAVDDESSEAWVLYKEEPLSEGEVSFG